jgi:hypothetical protein
MSRATQEGKMDRYKLVEMVLAQILKDVADGDITAIEELLFSTPDAALMGYLPEESANE